MRLTQNELWKVRMKSNTHKLIAKEQKAGHARGSL
jgi:hypothetical protein